MPHSPRLHVGQGKHRLYGMKSTLHIVYFRGQSVAGSAYICVPLALPREMKAFGGGTRRLALMALGRGNGGKRRYIYTMQQEVRRENSPLSRLVSEDGWREREGVLGNDPLRTIQDPTQATSSVTSKERVEKQL